MKKLLLLLLAIMMLVTVACSKKEVKFQDFVEIESRDPDVLAEYFEEKAEKFAGNLYVNKSFSFLELTEPDSDKPFTGVVVLNQDDEIFKAFTKEVEINKDFKFSIKASFKDGKLDGKTVATIKDITKISDEMLEEVDLEEYEKKAGPAVEIVIPFKKGKIDGEVKAEIDDIDFFAKAMFAEMGRDLPIRKMRDVHSKFTFTAKFKEDNPAGEIALALSNVNGIFESINRGKIDDLNSDSELKLSVTADKFEIEPRPLVQNGEIKLTLENSVALANAILDFMNEKPIESVKAKEVLTITVPFNEEGINGRAMAKVGDKEIGYASFRDSEPHGAAHLENPDGGVIFDEEFYHGRIDNGYGRY